MAASYHSVSTTSQMSMIFFSNFQYIHYFPNLYMAQLSIQHPNTLPSSTLTPWDCRNSPKPPT